MILTFLHRLAFNRKLDRIIRRRKAERARKSAAHVKGAATRRANERAPIDAMTRALRGG